MIATRAQAVWQRVQALPVVVHIAFWLVLVTAFAGPAFLLFFAPVAAGLWLWEARRARRFDLWSWARHLFEMIVAMYLGMFAYHALVVGPLIALGFGAVIAGDLSYGWMTLSMVVGMVAFMRYQGHSWRMANEMTLGMVAPVAVCFALVGLGICPLVPFLAWLTPTTVYAAAHDGMLLGMLAVMVIRSGMYAVDHASAHQAPVRQLGVELT